jgi:hypothetical protein
MSGADRFMFWGLLVTLLLILLGTVLALLIG